MKAKIVSEVSEQRFLWA